jgi:hypothetical protein
LSYLLGTQYYGFLPTYLLNLIMFVFVINLNLDATEWYTLRGRGISENLLGASDSRQAGDQCTGRNLLPHSHRPSSQLGPRHSVQAAPTLYMLAPTLLPAGP